MLVIKNVTSYLNANALYVNYAGKSSPFMLSSQDSCMLNQVFFCVPLPN
jgi:hypothetical protein